ncbi:16S rRNA (guanine(527)-N(7))-methyltransferase RsmG [uncultured Pseudokineococcus sp.]|uniref:16S rRNA (guanine(527)-N(7))-methyltransferase RsmG n=1 Tax=uncultured Pseudokineococcus sp. TaxID=1642928 RepID=UPI0026299A2B|nr:16S rRNA (guanine(527)-N(7))-methyltransferase RsmG [uncultured Pseudokineococcus sp.]
MELPDEPEVAAQVLGPGLEGARVLVRELAGEGVVRGVIGPREVPRLWSRHVLNCAVVAELVPEDVVVLDVGSGAGLPGLVLALARPDLELVLVDSALRRVRWLEHAVEVLDAAVPGPDLRVRVVRARAEELAGHEEADVVTSRAVAPLDRLARWCAPLVAPGGQLLAVKGGTAADEVAAHGGALVRAGLLDPEVLTCGDGLLDEVTTVVRARVGARSARARRRS